MRISNIEYHFVLVPVTGELISGALAETVETIIRDIVAGWSCEVRQFGIDGSKLQLSVTASPERSPTEIVNDIMLHSFQRASRVHPELNGYGRMFREDFYVKTGNMPETWELEDFLEIVKERT